MSDDALLQNYIDPSQLRQDLQFDLTDLDESMSRHAGLFLHYSQAAVNARAQHDRFVAAFEILESQLDNSYRTTLKGENPKTTEPQIRAAIVEDPRWKAAQGRVIKAKTIWKLAETAERAFEHRKDMLLQIARGNQRESEGQLRVMKNQAAVNQRERFLNAASAAASSSAA